MKLWIALYIFGKVSASWGPLPYGIDECRSRIIGMGRDIQEAYATKNLTTDDRMKVDGRQITQGDIAIKCLWADSRPE